MVNPYLFQKQESLELYKKISAPLLAVEASDNSLEQWWKGKYTLAEYHERLQYVPKFQMAVIEDAGHMLHHDQPEILARHIENHLNQPTS